jgi:hypothetical protein
VSKDQGRRMRRSPGEQSAPASVSRPRRAQSQAGSTAERETTTGRRLASPTVDRGGGLAQDLTRLASGLGRVAAQALWQMRIGRFRAAVADARQLVRRHPLQAVLVGVGLGYFLSRAKGR